MHALLVLAIAVGAVSADVGLGYNYKVPHTSYGVPSYQVSGSSSGVYNTGYNAAPASNSYVYKGQTGFHGLSAGQNNGYQGGYTGLQSGVAASNAFQSAGNAYQTAGNAYQQQAGNAYQQQATNAYQQQASNKYQSSGAGNQYHTAPSAGVALAAPQYQVGAANAQNGFQTFNQYQTASQYQEKYQHQYQIQQQPAQVFKHFYVHAAPEEPEAVRPRNPIVLPPPQKHYKIIFIKTPAQAGIPPQYIPVQQQNEEKTIVYVLVKKPEDYQDVVVPKIEQKPPSKPEVYFIKYNSKKEEDSVINNIVNDYKGQSASYSTAGSDASGSSSGSSGLITGVSSSGDYSELSNVGSGQIAATQTESQLLSNLATTFGQTAHGESHQTSHGESHQTESHQTAHGESQQANFGTDFGSGTGAVSLSSSGDNGSFSSSTANSVNAISTSQGVPHEAYGVPKFKEE